MKKKKVGVVVSSVAAIAVCTSVIVGSTYALFTSEDKVNIAVTSGKLGVTAEINSITTSSTLAGENKNLDTQYDAESKTLTVQNMLPGDVVNFEVAVTSVANVDIQYRLSFGCTEEDNELFSQLLLGVADKTDGDISYDYYISHSSAWETERAGDGSEKVIATKLVSLELPAYVSSARYQEKSCEISFAVEAVQGNAGKSDEAEALRAYRIAQNDTADLAEKIQGLKSGEAVILDGGIWDSADIELADDDSRTIVVNGYKVNNLTINAPEGSVICYNDVKSADIEAVATQSLHVFGEVTTLTLKQGRAVVEGNAKVGEVIVDAKDNAVTKVVVEEKAVITTLDVQKTGESAVLENKGVIGNIVAKEDVAIEMKHWVNDGASLVEAAKRGGEIVLTADIVCAEQILIPEGVTVTLDLDGHSIESQFAGPAIWNEGSLTITGNGRVHNTSAVADYYSHDAIRNFGYLVIENGTFGDADDDQNNANTEHRGAALRNVAGATCIINGGNFTCGDNYYTWGSGTDFSYAIRNAGKLTINDANMYGAMNGGISTESSADALTVINGGTFSVTGVKSFHVLTRNAGRFIVNGGKFIKEHNGGVNGSLLSVFSGMPSWEISENLEANGYTIKGGTFVLDGETVTFDQNS